MKKILWVLIVANILYCFVQFMNIISPIYIISLLLLVIMYNKLNEKDVEVIISLISIAGIVLGIFIEINFLLIGSGIIMLFELLRESINESNERNYKYNSLEEKSEVSLNREHKTKEIVVTKYDTDVIKTAFLTFAKDMENTNEYLDKKILHCVNVAENTYNIAKSINLDEEGVFLAYLIGILHDIGTIDNLKTGSKEEIDHGQYGAGLLKQGLIRQFIKETRYDDIIFKVVGEHNKFKVIDKLNDDEMLYLSIVRDADKLDLLKRFSEGRIASDYDVEKYMNFSQDILNEFDNEKIIDYNRASNNLDNVVTKISMVYDINYDYTLKQIKSNDYLTKYIMRVDTTDTTRIQLKKLVDRLYEYIDKKAK